MALGTREILLVIRARDEASRVLGRLNNQMRDLDNGAAKAAQDAMARGGALVSLGAGMAAVGAAMGAFFVDATNAAGEYETQARRALTQADGVQVSLQQLKDLGREVAREIPVPFEEMQKSLYSIFSTIDTDLPGAEKLLREFSKAAVAGQTDLEVVTTGTLQTLNAFGLGVEGVTRVNDVMFQLVRKGVGTFEEFIVSIGKASPSAKRAGQDVESLAGMLAFMTRNGLSTSMAATSAARAFDLLASPKVIDRMEKMGVEVRDAEGNFRPMTDVVNDLGVKMSELAAPERAEALTNLFKGSGNNVQARRFFDLAIPGFQQLNDLTGSMRNSAGAMGEAYDIMFDSPKAKMQALQNQYDAMKTEIGDQLLPYKMKLLQVLTDLMKKWTELSPTVQKTIIIIAAAAAGFMVLVGILIMIAGAFIMLQGAALLAGTTLGAIAVPALIVIGIIAAVGVAIWAIIKYWDEIVAATKTAWAWIVDIFTQAWDAVWGAIEGPVMAIVNWFKDVWQEVSDFFSELWNRLVGPIQGGWNSLADAFRKGVEFVKVKLEDFWKTIQGVLVMLEPAIKWMKALFEDAWNGIKMVWGWIVGIFMASLPIWQAVWGVLLAVLENVWKAIKGVLSFAVEIFIGLWDGIVAALGHLWEGITNIFGGILDFISNFFGFFVALFTGNWDKLWGYFKGMWDGIVSVMEGIFDILTAPFAFALEFLGGLFAGIGQLFITGLQMFLNLFDALLEWGAKVVDWFKALPGAVWEALEGAWNWVYDLGRDILQGLIDGLDNFWTNVTDWWTDMIDSLWTWIKDLFGIHSPSSIFAEIGENLLQGFLDGLKTAWDWVWGWISGFGERALRGWANIGTWLLDKGKDLLSGFLNGLRAGWDWVWNYITNFPGNLLRGFSNIGNWLVDAGGDLLRGLWNGINGTISWLKNKVMEWAGSLLPGWVKSILGISSPSKVFAQLGEYTMLGFAVGMDRGVAATIDSATHAANAITSAFNTNIGFDDPSISGFGAGYLGGGSYAAGGGSVTTGGGSSTAVKIDIHTQEINPLQHAAELGNLIVNRVG
jgi:TP901 family phage tail tape measure protein